MDKIDIGAQTFIPMPVALIGAIVRDKPNFMTAGWITRVNFNPPLIGVAINKSHYTPLGITAHAGFSVNFPGAGLVDRTDYCGLVSGRKTDKSGVFEVFRGKLENVPMIRECPLCLECKLFDIVNLPTNNFFIGEIVAAYTEDKYLTDGKPDIRKMNLLILTMPDNAYWGVGEFVEKAWSVGRKLCPP